MKKIISFLQILQNITKMNKFLIPKVIQKLKLKNYIHFKVRIFLNNKKINKIRKKFNLVDQEGNKIFIENFEYLVNDSLFKSLGFIEIQDTKNNIYQFSQVYIDTKKEILGTRLKAYINDKNFKIRKNDPRIFSNTINIKDGVSTFDKVFLRLSI